MSTNLLSGYIGKAGLVRLGAMEFTVTVQDAKQSYGKTRLLVTPSNGTGQEWKDADSVRMIERPTPAVAPTS